MTRLATFVLPCAAIAFFAAGCPAPGAAKASLAVFSDDPKAERAFDAAVALYDAGELARADAAFAAFTAEFARDPLYGGAVVFRARIAIAQGAPKAALELCASLEGARVDRLTKERARLYEGIAAAALGEHDRATRLLTPFLGALTDPAENELLLASLWRAAVAQGDLGRALTWLDAYLALPPADDGVAAARSALDALLVGVDDPDRLEEAAATVDPRGATWPRVFGRLVRARYDRGDLDGAAAALAELVDAGRDADAGVADVALLIEKRSRVDLASIGCILPLSGRSRVVGEAALRGVMLGAKELQTPEGRAFSIVVRDTEGSPERAGDVTEELVVGTGVAALIGPLDGDEAERVAARAAQLGVPLLLLAPQDDLVTGGAFRIFPSPRAEIAALVEAAASTGAKRHAILYPNSGYGAVLRDLYAAQLVRFGLEPLAKIAYPEGTTDFTPFARQLAGRGVEVVFVPDAASRIALAAPALAAAGVLRTAQGASGAAKPGGILAAPAVGLSPDLVRRAGRYLQGALFVSHFFETAMPAAARFAERFRSEYRAEPSHYAAYGHDAALLLEAAISRGGAKGRTAIAAWLRARGAGDGADLGAAARFEGFDATGAPTAAPFVITLVGEAWEISR
ncbi:MAG: ABC transporter substrate-binding protein [Proteobacteria bacterium]|jgi:ABC-type branched-subunit amino acid transport system substrate-binding protein/tetratricopeptide (TPR) repeat protein|nr:ABC transporter substrate-binding protein [Pseudomonadota bacterium]